MSTVLVRPGPSAGTTATTDNDTITASTTQTDLQIAALRLRLIADLPACDLQWTLFVAAAQSFRYDTKLSPYPARFTLRPPAESSGALEPVVECDIDAILKNIAAVPRLTRILWSKLSASAVDLLYWVLCEHGDATVRVHTVPAAEHAAVMALVASETPLTATMRPLHVFRLADGLNAAGAPTSFAEERFRGHRANGDGAVTATAEGRPTMFAFHGSRMESFHSISSRGLQQHLCKQAMFGEGIYLSSEMLVSMPFSPAGGGWRLSGLGTQLSCMAVCEFVEHEQHLQRRTSEQTEDQFPEKYFVITNNDIVRVRYLLIFGKPLVAPPPPITDELQAIADQEQIAQPPTPVVHRRFDRVRTLVYDHMAFCVVLAYVLMLLTIGFMRSDMAGMLRMNCKLYVHQWLRQHDDWSRWWMHGERRPRLNAADIISAIRSSLSGGGSGGGGGGAGGSGGDGDSGTTEL